MLVLKLIARCVLMEISRPSNDSRFLQFFFQIFFEVFVAIDQRKTGILGFPQQVLHLGESEEQEQPFYRLPMKRLSPSYELIFHQPLLLVGEELAMFEGHLFAEFIEPGLHQIRRGFRVEIMDGEFVKFSAEEASLDRASLGFGQKSFVRTDSQDAQSGLLSGQGDRNIQGMFSRPNYQFFRRIAPMQTEGRLKDSLGRNGTSGEEEKQRDRCPEMKQPAHGGTFKGFLGFRKARSRRRGMLLIEAGISLSILTFIGLMLLKLSLNILTPRQWGLQQTLTDAYMTYERAYAERVPFENLLASGSPWPAFPTTSTSSVEIGRLPGNTPILGTVTRTRIPDPGNYPIDGGTGTVATNPAAMKVWKVQSVITYSVGNRNYAKSRTVLRAQ